MKKIHFNKPIEVKKGTVDDDYKLQITIDCLSLLCVSALIVVPIWLIMRNH